MRKTTFTITNITCTLLGIFDINTKACYDRMLMAFCYLRSQQLDMPTQAHSLTNKWLNQAEYILQTNLGKSEYPDKEVVHPLQSGRLLVTYYSSRWGDIKEHNLQTLTKAAEQTYHASVCWGFHNLVQQFWVRLASTIAGWQIIAIIPLVCLAS